MEETGFKDSISRVVPVPMPVPEESTRRPPGARLRKIILTVIVGSVIVIMLAMAVVLGFCFRDKTKEDQQTCKPEEFTCDNLNCVDNSWVCDGEDDCGDYSDEQQCPEKTLEPDQYSLFGTSPDQTITQSNPTSFYPPSYPSRDDAELSSTGDVEITSSVSGTVTAEVGGNVMFTCKSSDNHDVIWILHSPFGDIEIIDYPPFTITSTKTSGVTTSLLSIDDVTRDDAAQYTCQEVQDPRHSDTVTLIVTAAGANPPADS